MKWNEWKGEKLKITSKTHSFWCNPLIFSFQNLESLLQWYLKSRHCDNMIPKIIPSAILFPQYCYFWENIALFERTIKAVYISHVSIELRYFTLPYLACHLFSDDLKLLWRLVYRVPQKYPCINFDRFRECRRHPTTNSFCT